MVYTYAVKRILSYSTEEERRNLMYQLEIDGERRMLPPEEYERDRSPDPENLNLPQDFTSWRRTLAKRLFVFLKIYDDDFEAADYNDWVYHPAHFRSGLQLRRPISHLEPIIVEPLNPASGRPAVAADAAVRPARPAQNMQTLQNLRPCEIRALYDVIKLEKQLNEPIRIHPLNFQIAIMDPQFVIEEYIDSDCDDFTYDHFIDLSVFDYDSDTEVFPHKRPGTCRLNTNNSMSNVSKSDGAFDASASIASKAYSLEFNDPLTNCLETQDLSKIKSLVLNCSKIGGSNGSKSILESMNFKTSGKVSNSFIKDDPEFNDLTPYNTATDSQESIDLVNRSLEFDDLETNESDSNGPFPNCSEYNAIESDGPETNGLKFDDFEIDGFRYPVSKASQYNEASDSNGSDPNESRADNLQPIESASDEPDSDSLESNDSVNNSVDQHPESHQQESSGTLPDYVESEVHEPSGVKFNTTDTLESTGPVPNDSASNNNEMNRGPINLVNYGPKSNKHQPSSTVSNCSESNSPMSGASNSNIPDKDHQVDNSITKDLKTNGSDNIHSKSNGPEFNVSALDSEPSGSEFNGHVVPDCDGTDCNVHQFADKRSSTNEITSRISTPNDQVSHDTPRLDPWIFEPWLVEQPSGDRTAEPVPHSSQDTSGNEQEAETRNLPSQPRNENRVHDLRDLNAFYLIYPINGLIPKPYHSNQMAYAFNFMHMFHDVMMNRAFTEADTLSFNEEVFSNDDDESDKSDLELPEDFENDQKESNEDKASDQN